MIRGRGNLSGGVHRAGGADAVFSDGGAASPATVLHSPRMQSDRLHTDHQFRLGWIEGQLQERRNEFVEDRPLNVHVASWNVGGAKKTPDDIAPWLLDQTHGMPDVLAIGFQEIVDLSAGNLLMENSAAQMWEKHIERTLEQRYQLIFSRTLVGVALLVYVKRQLGQFVTEILEGKVGVGLMGVGGNKGAVAVRFKVFDSTFCFINAHLAAHQFKVLERNSDYHSICSRIAFRKTAAGAAGSGAVGAGLGGGVGAGAFGTVAGGSGAASGAAGPAGSGAAGAPTIFDHDHVFWMGDLNYRLNLTDLDSTYDRVAAADWPYLLAHDQLLQEKAAGNAFKEWSEGPITFAPTYKYVPGTHDYDRRPDKKKRVPAWCDRIQWIGSDVKLHFYRRAELCLSDHKPVCALFTVKSHVVVPEKRQAVVELLNQQLDAWENALVPKVDVAPAAWRAGQVAFDTPYTQKIRVVNTGDIHAQFYLVARAGAGGVGAAAAGAGAGASAGGSGGGGSGGGGDGARLYKDWLSVWPHIGYIPPKQSVELNLEIKVTKKHAFSIASELDDFTESVCIRVEGGGDVVVPVSAVYQRSCYGMPLTWLVHCAGPARTTLPPRLPMLMQPAQPAVADSAAATASSSASSAAVSSTAAGAAPPGTGAAASLPLPVPAELWRLIDTLDAQHLDTPGLFVVNGNAREMILIREALDVGMHFPPNLTAHSYAESLVRFLELLHEPVFPAALAHAYADTGLPLGTFCHNALQLLPPAHYNTFVYVVSFLRKVLQRAAANQLSPVQLVLVFAGCLMQEDVAVTTSGAAAAGEGAYAPLIVLKHYITSHEFE